MHQPRFLIYRSSAGSGKTQTLAGEYLKLVLSGRAHFSNVLAITFTNKAAGEMKERVLQLLAAFASGDALPQYQTDLLQEISKGAGSDVGSTRMKAGEIRREMLHHYSDFNIGTIDSFVHRIIRSFALELNLSYAFDVQLDTQTFNQTAIEDLLAKTGADAELTESLVGFTRSLLEDEKSWNISRALESFAGFLTGEESMPPLEKLATAEIDFRLVAKSNRKAMQLMSARWDEILKQADEKIRNCGRDHTFFSNGLKGGIYTFFAEVLEKEDYARVFHREEKAKRVTGYMEEGTRFYPQKTPIEAANVLDTLAVELRSIWHVLTSDIDCHFPEFVIRRLVAENLTHLSLSKKIREQMQITMDRENMIPIYEFNRLIWNIIRNQPVPFIYERTSERFDHFLIDEFQDTSSLQWLNLLPLIENSLSQGGMSMVVGDAKQAIYRWRNGDVWQFVRLPEVENKDGNPLLAARADALKRYADEGFLRANFRSAPEIIRFNNDFFSWLRDQHPETLGAIYRDSDQVTGRQDAVGYVELHMVPWEKELRQADYSEAVASAVLEKVRRVLGQPGTTFTPSDICILVRTNAEAGVVATKLIEGEIDVVSDDSFPLGSFPEPLMIKALVGLLVDRQSTLHGAVVLTQLYRGGRISHDSLHLFLTGMASGKSAGGAALWHEVDKWFAAAGVERSMNDYLSLPLYECCEQVIRDFFGTNASAPAVQHLLDLTANFIQTNGNDLSKFVEYIDEQLKKSVPLPETGQAVRIMTIHKAKGLQFPVVIYAFAMESTFHSGNRNRMLWVDNSEEMNIEDLPVLLLPFRDQLTITPFSAVFEKERNALLQDLANVVYVALTRPVSRLYVVSSPRSRKSGGEEYLYDIFEKYLAQNQLFQSDDQIVFRYGTELIPEVKSNESMEDGTFRLPAWQSYSWQGRIGIRSGRLIPSEGSARQQALARGILFHNLLASITERVDAAKALDDFVNQGLIPEEEHGQWEKDLKELLSMEGVEPFFRKGAAYRTEATIITPDGRQLRPDKVVKFDDQIGVLDFKTGYPKPEHKKQVANYCDLLRAMGHKSVTGYLLYIDERVLITI